MQLPALIFRGDSRCVSATICGSIDELPVENLNDVLFYGGILFMRKSLSRAVVAVSILAVAGALTVASASMSAPASAARAASSMTAPAQDPIWGAVSVESDSSDGQGDPIWG
ncbi:hypothetical protein [Streptomyces sp. NPDC052107]|uniref:hypothetical protein n=1 Tax=Streptomyces sp. NPDC052107 TaxID=3155632 RepID=UPI00341DF9A6